MYIRIPDAIFFLFAITHSCFQSPGKRRQVFGMIGGDGEKGVSQRGIVGHRQYKGKMINNMKNVRKNAKGKLDIS